MKKNGIAIIAVLILVSWGIYDYVQNNKPQIESNNKQQITAEVEVGIQKGDAAVDFELLNLDGTPAKLSDYKGKKVILNFWATWCPPCRAEMPHMERFYEDNEDV